MLLDDPNIWAEIDLRAVAANVRALRGITRPEAMIMAVVKADGYGHGAVEVARTALDNGAERLAVARTHEGVELREAGIEAPVLVFGHTGPADAPLLWRYGLAQSVSSADTASRLAEAARREGATLPIHIKIDTGMGRMGILPDCGRPGGVHTPVEEVLAVDRMKGLETEGIFTHFAAADSADKTYARLQFDLFLDFIDQLRRTGLEPPIRHAANSAALIDLPETHLDAVRPGIALYGLYPSREVNTARVPLRPAMTLKSRIIQLKEVPAGFKVSYGMTYETRRQTRIATVPVGYADGIQRRLSNIGWMLVRGKRAPIAGRVCMDLTMLDVGEIDGVAVGEEVVIMGRQGGETMTADEMAEILGTINYEVVFTNAGRVPRIYLR
ncbi:MAG: alanine racemase [Desulfobacterales bacterium]